MIGAFHSFPDCGSLLGEINNQYQVGATEIYLYRDMIGSVYFLQSSYRKYVFKLFRGCDTEQALQSLDIVQYLKKNDYPVVSVVPAHAGDLYIVLTMPEGKRIGILYDFLEGEEPDFQTDMEPVGRQIGKLHQLMKAYPRGIIKRGKEFFIDRYLNIMKDNQYQIDKINDLDRYGTQLWRNLEQLPNGFCHGDLHSGNMVKSGPETFTLFDFDIASYAFPIIDAATLSDKTNFNRLDESAYENTQRQFDKFYQGYAKERILSDIEAAAIIDFIAIRHYELNATIINYRLPIEGRHWLGNAVFDEQYHWLMKWEDISARKK